MPPTVSCAGCKRLLSLPDNSKGRAFRCPDCGTPVALPADASGEEDVVDPLPDEPESEGPVGRRPRRRRTNSAVWTLCLLLTCFICVLHCAGLAASQGAPQSAAISAEAAAWTVAVYVIARAAANL
jgi:hypothetical protein